MNHHTIECPRCGSREIRRRPKGFLRDLDQTLRMNISVGWSFRLAVKRASVCTACGHLEEWIEDDQALKYIAERWPSAND